MPRPQLTLFLDVVSPFAYLAFYVTKVREVFLKRAAMTSGYTTAADFHLLIPSTLSRPLQLCRNFNFSPLRHQDLGAKEQFMQLLVSSSRPQRPGTCITTS